MPKPAVESGAQGGSPNNQSSMPSMPAIDVANTVKELMGGAGAGLAIGGRQRQTQAAYLPAQNGLLVGDRVHRQGHSRT